MEKWFPKIPAELPENFDPSQMFGCPLSALFGAGKEIPEKMIDDAAPESAQTDTNKQSENGSEIRQRNGVQIE